MPRNRFFSQHSRQQEKKGEDVACYVTAGYAKLCSFVQHSQPCVATLLQVSCMKRLPNLTARNQTVCS